MEIIDNLYNFVSVKVAPAIMKKFFVVIFCCLMLHIDVAQNNANANKKLAGDKVITGIFNYDLATQILDETNRQREAAGVPPVKMTKLLCDMAMLRAAEAQPSLPHANDNPHNRPNGQMFYTILDKVERCSRTSENIHYGSFDAQRIVTNWMSSEGHRRNLLDSLVTTIGVGAFVWFDDDGELVDVIVSTQLFSDCPTNLDYRPSSVEKVQVKITSKPDTKSRIIKREEYKVAPDTY